MKGENLFFRRTIERGRTVQQGLVQWVRTLAIVASIFIASLIFFLGAFKSSRAQRLPMLSYGGSVEAGILLGIVTMALEARTLARAKRENREG